MKRYNVTVTLPGNVGTVRKSFRTLFFADRWAKMFHAVPSYSVATDFN